MALRNYNQRDFDKFNDPNKDVLGEEKKILKDCIIDANKKEKKANPPKKLAGENTSEIKMDKNENPFALVLESTQSGLVKGDTIRPGKAPRSGNYIMGGDYTVTEKSKNNYEID